LPPFGRRPTAENDRLGGPAHVENAPFDRIAETTRWPSQRSEKGTAAEETLQPVARCLPMIRISDFQGVAMTDLILSHPVYTLENEQLLPAGTRLTNELLEELASAGEAKDTPHVSVLSHAQVAEHLKEFCSKPPYTLIFSDPEQKKLLFQQMARIRLSRPLIGFLDYFRVHDFYTYQHTLTVFALSMLLAHELEKDPEQAVRQALGAPTHDFGKFCIPISLLKKATPLTKAERARLQHHTLAGYVLLTLYTGNTSNPAAVAARDHHERVDGSGYPSGKRLQNRMVEIVAVTDIFDAMIVERPYRKEAFDTRTALEQITLLGEEGRISWDVIQALVNCNRKDRRHYTECNISLEKRGTPPPGNLYGVTAD
jgi:HD-GYP domain-containing protein (c-di-GMP phosphodiesterase class II)